MTLFVPVLSVCACFHFVWNTLPVTLLVPVLSVCACFHFAPSVIHSQTAKGNRLITFFKATKCRCCIVSVAIKPVL